MDCIREETEIDNVLSDNQLFSFKQEKEEDSHQQLLEKEDLLNSLLCTQNGTPEDLVVVDFVPGYVLLVYFICK